MRYFRELSLRAPQRESLEILSRVCDIISLDKGADHAQSLAANMTLKGLAQNYGVA